MADWVACLDIVGGSLGSGLCAPGARRHDLPPAPVAPPDGIRP